MAETKRSVENLTELMKTPDVKIYRKACEAAAAYITAYNFRYLNIVSEVCSMAIYILKLWKCSYLPCFSDT